MNVDLWYKIRDYVEQNRLDAAVADLEAGLAACESPRFKGLIAADFTNEPSSIVDHLNGFIAFCEAKFPLAAIYLEMNGFDINVDLWYFDSFGYRRYVDTPDNLEWLPYWNSADYPIAPLTGLESVQREYDWYSNQEGHKDTMAREAADFAALLVMCKFARLISRAVETNKIGKSVPILASAHDFNIIPKFRP
jgi:hypothetical protein